MSSVLESIEDAAGAAEKPALAEFIGSWVAGLAWSDLPEDVRHWARVGIFDTIGVTLAGARENAPVLAAAGLDLAQGPALVLGQRRRIGMLDASLINGTASHVLDFDDCSNTMGGHPSAPLVSAMLALSDSLDVCGRDFLTAFAAGFEVETKIGMVVNLHHYMKGWHPTSTLGVFGVAAACARLMDLNARQTAVAIAIAASFASGLKVNFGTMTKPLHVGHCARSGLYAARLAAAGFSARPSQVFEHKQGFLEVFNGEGTYDVARAMNAWAAPWDLAAPGIAIKQYPCCGSTHPAIDSMLNIVREHGPKAEDVERIDIRTHSRRLQHTNRPLPNSGLDAKFSVQYAVASALLHGAVGIETFDGEGYRSADVVALLERTHAAPYDQTGEGDFHQSNHFGGYVKVTLRDGRVLTSQVDMPLGRTSSNALPEALMKKKFELCTARILNRGALDGIVDAIWRIADQTSIRALTGLIEAQTL